MEKKFDKKRKKNIKNERKKKYKKKKWKKKKKEKWKKMKKTQNPLLFFRSSRFNLENPVEPFTMIPKWLLQTLASPPQHVPSTSQRLARHIKSSKIARNIVARNFGNIARIIRNIRNLSEKERPMLEEETIPTKPFFRVYSK